MIRHILHLIFDNFCRTVALGTFPSLPSWTDTAIYVPVHVACGPDRGGRRSYGAQAPSGLMTGSPETAHQFQSGSRWHLDMTSDGSGRNNYER